jgi:hypothetical protein
VSEIEATKFYVRSCRAFPDTEMIAYARRGFWFHGVPTEDYVAIAQVTNASDLSQTVGVTGWIADVHAGLRALGKPIPAPLDYPDRLSGWLKRDVWRSTIGAVRQWTANPNGSCFVKPAANQKLFTGMVWKGDDVNRAYTAECPEDTEVWCSDILDFHAEYRTFILDGEILDCRRYKGDWGLAPDRVFVEQMVEAFKPDAPRAYTLDVGVLEDRSCALIEVNDGFSFGHYGLDSDLYARMLSARWHEMTA